MNKPFCPRSQLSPAPIGDGRPEHVNRRCAARRHILATALVLAAGQVAAQTPPAAAPQGTASQLESVTVTATRLDTTLREAARSIAKIDRMTIESLQAQSVAQTLLYEPNITAAGGPRAANQEVNIRGLTGNKVLQTVDGARQSFESGHRPGYFLDPELLASVEAVRGPVSSLWGSGALGGVIAQRTLRADDFLSEGRDIGGFLKTGYNSNNQQHTSTAAALGRSAGRDWVISGYQRDSDDLELGNGDRLEGSAFENRGLLAKLRTDLGEDHSLEMIYRAAQFEGAVPSNGSAAINPSSNFLLRRDQTTHNASVDYRYNPESDWLDTQVLLYANRVEMDESRISDARADSTELGTVGINLSNRSQIGSARLLYGIDSYREDFSARRSGADRPMPPQARSDVWSIYSEAQLPLDARWRLDIGLRYDDFRTRADNLNTARGDNAFSPSVALRFSPTETMALTLRHDRAFRAPSAEELYSTGTHFCIGPGLCNSFAPNPELESERAANTELLGYIELPGLRAGDHLRLSASLFENRVDNFIEQIVTGPSFRGRPDPGSTTWVNVDEASLRGGELSATYTTDRLQLRLGYGQTRGRDENSGEDLSNVPADTLNMDLRYAFTARAVVAGLRLTHALDQSRTRVPGLSPQTRFDGYSIADVYASWSPQLLPDLRLDLNINNLTDRFYQRAWDQLPQAGREVIVSAVYRF